MCVMSMVHDHYEPRVPWVQPDPYDTGDLRIPTVEPLGPFEVKPAIAAAIDLAALLKEFRELIEAAKLIDRKTNQPDCVDPE
jgi:hypothetical protein